jgi:hypothetical protein
MESLKNTCFSSKVGRETGVFSRKNESCGKFMRIEARFGALLAPFV